jgi:hypothetical protein
MYAYLVTRNRVSTLQCQRFPCHHAAANQRQKPTQHRQGAPVLAWCKYCGIPRECRAGSELLGKKLKFLCIPEVYTVLIIAIALSLEVSMELKRNRKKQGAKENFQAQFSAGSHSTYLTGDRGKIEVFHRQPVVRCGSSGAVVV